MLSQARVSSGASLGGVMDGDGDGEVARGNSFWFMNITSEFDLLQVLGRGDPLGSLSVDSRPSKFAETSRGKLLTESRIVSSNSRTNHFRPCRGGERGSQGLGVAKLDEEAIEKRLQGAIELCDNMARAVCRNRDDFSVICHDCARYRRILSHGPLTPLAL